MGSGEGKNKRELDKNARRPAWMKNEFLRKLKCAKKEYRRAKYPGRNTETSSEHAVMQIGNPKPNWNCIC